MIRGRAMGTCVENAGIRVRRRELARRNGY